MTKHASTPKYANEIRASRIRPEYKILSKYLRAKTHVNLYNPIIFVRIKDRLDFMLKKHCKVLVVRIDIRYPDGFKSPPDNKLVSILLKKMVVLLDEKKIDSQHVWVRERYTSPNPHYHVIFFMNGSKIQNPWGFLKIMDRIWSEILQVENKGCIEFCKRSENPYIMLRRPSFDDDTKNDDFNRNYYITLAKKAVYLVKNESKKYKPKGVRSYGASAMPPLTKITFPVFWEPQ